MRATLIGHACWAVETAAGTLLTDPVFFDPFEQGTVTSCPRREVDVDRLPELVAIFLSHRHIDHFDFPSLRRLDRSLPILCPEDPLLVPGLRELGFTDLRFLEPFRPIDLGGCTVTPVPSYSDTLEEYGAVFADASGTFFDQVDCPLTPAALERLEATFDRLDVHAAMYASQDFAFFESRRSDVAEVYANNVYAALRLGARLVVPGSAGFRFVDEVGWLNRHLFPISSDRFRRDLERLDPTLTTEDLLPGDTLVIEEGAPRVERATASFVRTLEDDTHLLAWDASAPIPPLTDQNPEGHDVDFLHRFVDVLVGRAMAGYLAGVDPAEDPVVGAYTRHGVRYRLEVVFPDGADRGWTFAFDRHDGLKVEEGPESEPAELRRRIAASALAEVASGQKSSFYARTRSRRAGLVLDLGWEEERLAFDEVRLDDLLMHVVVNLRTLKVGAERAEREYLGLYPTPDAGSP